MGKKRASLNAVLAALNSQEILAPGGRTGPLGCVEFLRRSENGRMTLVMDEFAEPIISIRAPIETAHLATVIKSLNARQRVLKHRRIGAALGWAARVVRGCRFALRGNHWTCRGRASARWPAVHGRNCPGRRCAGWRCKSYRQSGRCNPDRLCRRCGPAGAFAATA